MYILILIITIIITPVFAQPRMHLNQFNNPSESQNQLVKDYNNANFLFYQQKYKDALKIFENLLQNNTDKNFADIIEKRMAECYEKLGDYEQAIEINKNSLKRNPSDINLKKYIANLYRWQKKFDNAIEIFKEITPVDDNYYELLGNIYLEASKHEQALKTWQKIVDNDPKNLEKYKYLANIFYQEGLINEGIDIYLKARKIFNNQYLFTFELAELYDFQMEYKKVVDEYLSLLSKSPEYRENIQEKIIGLIIIDKSIYKYAVDKIRIMLEKNPENNNFRLLLVNILLKNNEITEALSEHEKIVKKIGDRKNILFLTLSEELEKMDYQEEAIKIYEQIDQNNVGYPFAQNKIIELLVESGKFESAIQKAQNFIAGNPRQDYLEVSLYYLAGAYFDLKNFQKARDYYLKVIKINPQSNYYNQCLFKIADTYFFEGNFQEAQKNYNNILNIYNAQQVHDYAYFMIGSCFVMLDEYDKGLEKLYEFIKKYKNSLYVNNALEEINFISKTKQLPELKTLIQSRIKIYQGKYNDAIKDLDKLIETNNDIMLTQYTYFQLGKLYIEIYQFDKALAAFKTLQTKAPESILSAFAEEKIAYIYEEKLKDTDKAITSYQKILIDYPGSILISKARENINKLRKKNIPKEQ